VGQIVDSLSHQTGGHALRIGADFLYNDTMITFPRSVRGSYTFGSLANFLSGSSGVYSSFAQTFGNPVIPQKNPNVGIYGQDEWRVGPGLTLNAGLRYDLQFLKTIHTDPENFSPRAGLAWSPDLSGKTIVRASFGIFYDRIPLRALANALLSANNTTNIAAAQQLTVSLQPTQTGAPLFPAMLPAFSSGVLLNFTTLDAKMQNPYSQQASVEIERQLGSRSTVSASYQHVRGVHLIIQVNQNTPTCVASGTNNGCRPTLAYGDNKQYSPAADSQYNGMTLSFVERPSKWGNFRVSYTYSKALDDVGEFFFSAPLNNYNIHQDWSRSDDDQRHRFVFDGSVHSRTGPARTIWEKLSNGFQLSTILQYYTAPPFNIVTGVTNVQQTTSRPCLGLAGSSPSCSIDNMIGRNAGTGFDYLNLNARLSRTIAITERMRAQAIVEAFNALNRPNKLIPNTRFGAGVFPNAPAAQFGQATAVSEPRQVQLGLRLSF
jgi:outer membrane receptor protein involved in Fe transport